VVLSFSLNNCVQSKIVDSPEMDGNNSNGGASSSNGGSTGGNIITLDPNRPLINPVTSTNVTTETVTCDGEVDCTCPPFNVAVIGKPGKWGANPGGDSDKALQEWLNTSSLGTAKADNFTTRVALTPEFLATYHVIIFASLSEDSDRGPFWTFDAAEVAAFQAWIEQGGGVITLIGYSGDGAEVDPVNQLIGFSGITYNRDGIWTMCVDHRVCACAHSNTLADWNKTDPVVANLSNSVTWVGLENGRSINAPADAHVAAKASDGKNALVGKVVGKGHVLAYGDEWITYTSQWNGYGNSSANDPTCAGFLPQDTYQIAQFWFNMIKWSQPTATCFKIENKQQPVIIW
jgi:hypothetical protein